MPDIRIPSNNLPAAGAGASDRAAPVTHANANAAAPTGLDAAAHASPTTRAGDVRQPGAPVGAPPQLRVRPTGIFDLTDRYPNAVALPTLLRQIATQAGKQNAATQLTAVLTKLGIQVPPELLAQAKRDPAKLLDALTVTPEQMSQGAAAAAAKNVGAMKPGAAPKHILPQNFDLANLDQVAFERPAGTLKRLAPGLYKGTLASNLPDAQAKRNTVFAEILDRLADNTSLAEADRFAVTVDGQTFGRIDAFLGELVKRGWTVDIVCAHRIANFTELNYKADGAPDATAVDVPAAVMVRTGVKDAQGKEAIVPSSHAEFRIHIAGPGDAPVEGNVKFYQGVPNTGFFPMNLYRDPEWCGGKNVPISADKPKLSGNEAVEILEDAGLLADLIKDVAKEKNLPMSGYGLTGVCMDSVQVLWTLAGGPLTYFPLLMRDGLLFAELDKRLNDGDKADDARYDRLRAAIAQVPSDLTPQPDAAARALTSLPWSPGDEAFKATIEARAILEAAGR